MLSKGNIHRDFVAKGLVVSLSAFGLQGLRFCYIPRYVSTVLVSMPLGDSVFPLHILWAPTKAATLQLLVGQVKSNRPFLCLTLGSLFHFY